MAFVIPAKCQAATDVPSALIICVKSVLMDKEQKLLTGSVPAKLSSTNPTSWACAPIALWKDALRALGIRLHVLSVLMIQQLLIQTENVSVEMGRF